jgi:hypothetical protein
MVWDCFRNGAPACSRLWTSKPAERYPAREPWHNQCAAISRSETGAPGQRAAEKAHLCDGVGLFPKRSAGLQPAMDFQARRTVASKGTLAQPMCGYKPVRDRRSGAARCAPPDPNFQQRGKPGKRGPNGGVGRAGAFAVRPPGKAAASGGKKAVRCDCVGPVSWSAQLLNFPLEISLSEAERVLVMPETVR